MNALDASAAAAASGRPTEAQLRWAQFRFQRRAANLKQSLERFWQTPASVDEVEGARSDDGNTTEESTDAAETKAITAEDSNRRSLPMRKSRNKPKISRGRRALLRVSQRRLEERQREIAERGFKCQAITEDCDVSSETEEEDALALIFADEQYIRRRRRRQNRRLMGTNELDRAKRFEEAFHAMMVNLAAAQPQQVELEAPTKVWTRPEGTDGIFDSIDFEGMKMMGLYGGKDALTKRLSKAYAMSPMDRGASWLQHLPKRSLRKPVRQSLYSSVDQLQQTDPAETGDHFSIISGMRASDVGSTTFHDIIDRLQSQLHLGLVDSDDFETPFKKVPRMKLSKCFQPRVPVNGRDEKKDDATAEKIGQFAPDSALDSYETPLRNNQPKMTRDTHCPTTHVEAAVSEMDEIPENTNLIHLQTNDDLSLRTAVQVAPTDQGRSTSGTADEHHLQDYARRYLKRDVTFMQSPIATLSPFDQSPHSEGLQDNVLLLAQRTTFDQMKLRETEASSVDDSIMQRYPIEWTKRLAAKIDDGVRQGVLISADGKLRKPEFARLINEYLKEAHKGFSNKAGYDIDILSNTKEEDGQNNVDEGTTSQYERTDDILATWLRTGGFVDRLIHQFEQMLEQRSHGAESAMLHSAQLESTTTGTFRKCSTFVDSTKTLTNSSIEGLDVAVTTETRIVEQMLAQVFCDASTAANPFIEEFVKLFIETIYAESFLDKSGMVDRELLSHAVYSCFVYVADMSWANRFDVHAESAGFIDTVPDDFVPYFIDLFCSQVKEGAIRFSDGTADFDDVVSTVLACSTEALYRALDAPFPANAHFDQNSFLRSTNEHNPTSKWTQSWRGTLSDFNRLSKNLEAAQYDQDDHDAVAAYHRRKHERPAHEDISSVSSFRPLPDGIKQVVEHFRKSYFHSRKHVDDDIGIPDNRVDFTPAQKVTEAASTEQISTVSTSSGSDLSHQYARELVSGLFHHSDGHGPVIDTDEAVAGGALQERQTLTNLLLSPSVLTKRHQQALAAIEHGAWDQARYLIKANPWLAEMTDIQTGQNLLHKLALCGSGGAVVLDDTFRRSLVAAPVELNADLMNMFPSAAHKIDVEGNLPLHLAAAAANIPMITLLGDRFPSGASVRNDDGLLPLHLVILAISSGAHARAGVVPTLLVNLILTYFPRAVAVADNQGNLPIHLAAGSLTGDVGVDVVNILMAEARKLASVKSEFLYGSLVKDPDDASQFSRASSHVSVDRESDYTLVLNKCQETPLLTAIRARAGSKIIEGLLNCGSGPQSILFRGSDGNSALHLLVSQDYVDPTSAMTVIKLYPEAALVKNEDGFLPIEMACINASPSEVILALALVDLPFEIDDVYCSSIRDGFGRSWEFLICECDDQYVGVVEEVLSLCSYEQTRALCFYNDVIGKATPQCRDVLEYFTLFLGRFELVGSDAPNISHTDGYQLFAAIDFGEDDGRRVILKYYYDSELFRHETNILQETQLDTLLVEEISIFAVKHGVLSCSQDIPDHFCISIEQPDLTLAGVLQSMLKSQACQTDFSTRCRYAAKIFSVLRVIAKSLSQLHAAGIVHGNVCVENCGKFLDNWKLTHMLGSVRTQSLISTLRLSHSAAPEAVFLASGDTPALRNNLRADPSLDVWAFGKLAYDALVGIPLIPFGEKQSNFDALRSLYHWDDDSLDRVCHQLARVGVTEQGMDLITHCLAAQPDQRPPMDAVLQHPIWKDSGL